MIFTSLSPNTERDDINLALKLLFSPWNWNKADAITPLENAFKDYLPASHAIAFQSGRNALYALLQALHIGPGDEVLIQGYTCVAVPEPVLWVGAKPVYIDVLEDFTMDPISLRKRVSSKSKVVIVQHTFGSPAHIKEIMAVAEQYNLFVIEDCAHALGAEYQGHKVGTFGDAAFFSFGRDKVISSVFGGMMVTNDESLYKKVKAIEQSFREPSAFYIIQQLLHPIILSLAKKTYTTASLGKIILEIAKRLHLISKAVEPRERWGGEPSFMGMRYPNALAYLALNQFAKLERFNEHRKTIANIYAEELISSGVTLPAYQKKTVSIVLRYTILVPTPKGIINQARAVGIELGDWYNQSIAPKGVEYEKIEYDPETCPNAERLAETSLNLPTHIQILEEDARMIANFVRERV